MEQFFVHYICNREVHVCKTFFLATLGYKTDKAVYYALKHVCEEQGVVIGTIGDNRGKHDPHHKAPADLRKKVEEHIESFRPQISHYRRDHVPYRRYLPADLTVKDMYSNFVNAHRGQNNMQCSYSFYQKIFLALNIGFSTPSNDLCKTCAVHKTMHPEAEHDCGSCDCDVCAHYPKHREDASQARKALHEDEGKMENDDSIVLATTDMQKAITLPKMPTKDHFFSRKLVIFNQTFATPGKNKDCTCVLWHEEQAGRKAWNVANAYVEFIKMHRDKERHILLR